MSSLDEFLALPAAQRRVRLGHGDTRNAVLALGPADGIAWLENNIESPVGPEWGRLLYSLNPAWSDLIRWLGLSKLHCLAAMDALLAFAERRYLDDDNNHEIPPGADPEAIHEALKQVLANYGNPRLRDAVKKIRGRWSIDDRKPAAFSIPPLFIELASVLLDDEVRLMKEWQARTAAESLHTKRDIWSSLLEFADCHQRIAIVDWSESSSEIVERIRRLKHADRLPIAWDKHAEDTGEKGVLFRRIGTEARADGLSFVTLETGDDSYALTFLATEEIPRIESLLASFDASLHIQKAE